MNSLRELGIHPFKIANARRGFQLGPETSHGSGFRTPGQIFFIMWARVPALIDYQVSGLVHVVIHIQALASCVRPGIGQIVFHKGLHLIHGLGLDLHLKKAEDYLPTD